MKKLPALLFLFFSTFVWSQEKVELTPNGFAAVEIPKPGKPMEDLMALADNWGYFYNKKGHDTYDVTTNSMTIDAMRKNAFYFMNVGQQVVFKIKYSLKIEFADNKCILKFSVKEIYNNDKVIQSTIADYFTPDGKLKEGYEEVKPSLEKTANDILQSFANYISR